MKEILSEIQTIDSVKASLFFSRSGDLLLNETAADADFTIQELENFSKTLNWKAIGKKYKNINETEFVFEKYRVYIRKADLGFLVVIMESSAPIEVVRLHSDLILPELNSIKKTKGFGRFFKFLP